MPAPSLVRLSMKQLSLLAAIEDAGALKRAAEVIGMSQPRATKALQEAEAVTGQRLFQRSNRGIVPTRAGDIAIRHAKTVLAQLASMEHELSAITTGAGSQLRVGTIMGAVPFVSETIRAFLERYPRTSVVILEDTSAELLRQLDRGNLDLVIGRHSVSAASEAYEVTVFHDEILKVVASPSHPLAGRKRLGLEDLSGSRWIVYTAAMPMRLSLEQEFRNAGLPFPLSLLETRSALTTMALIQDNPNTVALLSDGVAAFFANFGMAVTLPVHLRARSDPYEVITLQGKELPGHAQEFIAELVAGAVGNGST